MSGETEAEFDEDFGYSLRPPDVQRLLERARSTGDRDVRLLAKQHQFLRRVAADLLADLELRGLIEPQARHDSASPAS